MNSGTSKGKKCLVGKVCISVSYKHVNSKHCQGILLKYWAGHLHLGINPSYSSKGRRGLPIPGMQTALRTSRSDSNGRPKYKNHHLLLNGKLSATHLLISKTVGTYKPSHYFNDTFQGKGY